MRLERRPPHTWSSPQNNSASRSPAQHALCRLDRGRFTRDMELMMMFKTRCSERAGGAAGAGGAGGAGPL